MEIKVKNTKEHTYPSKKPYQIGVPLTCSVAEAKLVLVPCTVQDLPVLFRNKAGKYSLGISEPVSMWNPILISETEKIEEGDWYYNQTTKEFGQLIQFTPAHREKSQEYYYEHCSKVLALPEHFTSEQLRTIVDGKLKDDDKLLVECERVKILPGDVEKPLGKILYSGASAPLAYQIKSPLSIYPIEEKLYTREEIQALFNKYNQYLEKWANNDKYYWGIYNGNVALHFNSFIEKVNSKEWFEQNVK